MTIRYWWILITYILMQLSGAIVGVPILRNFGVADENIPGIWSVFSFTTAFIIILILLIPDIRNRHFERSRSTRGQAILWTISGVFMVFAAQYIAIIIQMTVFGIEPGSANTEVIVEVAKAVPLFMVVIAIIGPILEEIVFRLIIFGALYQKFNFWIAAIVSSLIFSVVHADLEHTLVYVAVGLTFAFLYVKTKRILVPIVAHVAINSFVVLVQVIFGEKIQELVKQLEQTQQFIGGLF